MMGIQWRKDSVMDLKKQKSRAELQKENEALRSRVSELEDKLNDTQMALCDVYEQITTGGETNA